MKTVVTNGCVVGCCCHVASQETLPENTVIFGSNSTRRVQGDRPAVSTSVLLSLFSLRMLLLLVSCRDSTAEGSEVNSASSVMKVVCVCVCACVLEKGRNCQ